MIKTNSELPITLLGEYNEKLNAFDLVLFHLYNEVPNYREYFKNMRINHPERMMILDNSAYEYFVKGLELNLDEYAKVIEELKPDYYILPDVLMNKLTTIAKVVEFIQRFSFGKSQPMAVLQGNTKEELKSCAKIYKELGIKNIAVPFHNSFFKDDYVWCDGDIANIFATNGYNFFNEDLRYAAGRCMWVKKNINLLKKFKKIHLLGSHCPAEKAFYETLDIQNLTMDTGYPVKCAIEGYELGSEDRKPNIIIDDFMNDKLDQNTIDLIVSNVNKFKNYNV